MPLKYTNVMNVIVKLGGMLEHLPIAIIVFLYVTNVTIN